MEKICVVLFLAFAIFAPLGTFSQLPQSSLDRYLESGKTIVVARCVSVGPVNILLKARVKVQILHVVKGKETLREITVISQYDMTPGEMYLLRTVNESSPDHNYFEVETIDSVIPISHHEDIETLKTLSPRIIVLRTMNSRVAALEADIRRCKFELEALDAARQQD